MTSEFLVAPLAIYRSKLWNFRYVDPSSDYKFDVVRSDGNPIIHKDSPDLYCNVGRVNAKNNINGPSLIKVPNWLPNPLGCYYLYFSHHHGRCIDLAYADSLDGPWKIYPGGVLPLETTPSYNGDPSDHVASPDVHVDHKKQEIRMYYHANPRSVKELRYQASYVAVSSDGIVFNPLEETLGMFYFRVVEQDGWYYAFAKYYNDGGIIYRSRDPLRGFEEGPRILPRVRHMALWENNGLLYVFFSRGQDNPEHILVSRVENLHEDWGKWRFTMPQSVLRPEKNYEGANKPIARSSFGATYESVHQVRDPAIYEEDGRLFLLYSAAGEQAIAISELHLHE